MKTFLIIVAIVAAIFVSFIGYKYFGWFGGPKDGINSPRANWDKINTQTTINDPIEVFSREGYAMDPYQKKKACSIECLEPYPAGSQYQGYYYCKKNCAVFQRGIEQPIYYTNYYPSRPFHNHNNNNNPPPPPPPPVDPPTV